MNGTANEQARAEAERVAAANAAGNHGGPPDAPPVNPSVAPAAAPLPAGLVVIGTYALAQIIAACQPPPHVAGAGAILPERAGSTRLKASISTDSVEWMSWNTHYLEVCEINTWPNIPRVREARAAMAEKAAGTRPTSSLSTSPTQQPTRLSRSPPGRTSLRGTKSWQPLSCTPAQSTI
jgi:hypothetical protein